MSLTAWSADLPPITEPCVIDGMPDDVYHRDPTAAGSFSSSGAKSLLKSPALYRWQQEHRVEKSTYDVGHAAHAKMLGVGMGVVEIPAEVLASNGAVSTKEAKAFIAAARAAGLVPLKADVIAEIDAMAESVLAHREARALLELPGKSEQSLFAPDPESGVWLRARIDRLPDLTGDRTLAQDLKTSTSADPHEFARTAATYGYDVQDAFYRHVLALARGDQDVAFLFIVVEKAPPYLVSVVELVAEFPHIGADRMRRAITTFKRCRDADDWPGYPGISYAEPPRYHVTQNEEEEAAA